jgi:hypothetical protein
MPKPKPPYPAEFREQIIELARAGRTPAQLSREFGPTAQSIANWIAQDGRDRGRPLAALNMALHTRRPNAVIHHSDQGSQYNSIAFGSRCREMGVRPSMGTVGDAYDNAMAESFFASLECELIDRRSWKSKAEARTALFTWIEGWYNPRRRHSALNYLSPINFERKDVNQKDCAQEHGVAHRVGRFVASADRRRGQPCTCAIIRLRIKPLPVRGKGSRPRPRCTSTSAVRLDGLQPKTPDEEILRRLLALNRDRSGRSW